MVLVMEQCPQCEKKMSKYILIKHLAKTHGVTSTEEVKKDDVSSVLEEKPTLESTTESSEPKKWYEKWDAGEINVCAQCKQEYPSKIMGWHIRFEHGL